MKKELKTILATAGLVAVFLLFSGVMNAQPDTVSVLVYTETKGYNHNTKTATMDLFNQMGQELFADDTTKIYEFTQDDNGNFFFFLDPYEVIVFANTSGVGGLSSFQQMVFQSWLTSPLNGHRKTISIHAASDAYYHSSANGSNTGQWDWYAENVTGATVQRSPNHTSSSHIDTIFTDEGQAMKGQIQEITIKQEEYYYWENGYLNNGWIVWQTVGRTGSNSYDEPRMVSQSYEHANGALSHYTSMGHRQQDYYSNSVGENGWIFKETLKNMLTITPALVTTFGIFIKPEKQPTPKIYDGYFIVDETPGLQTYTVSDITGKLLHIGEIEPGGRVPVMQVENAGGEPMIFLYKTNTRYWRHGVK